jgi:hypothetical protein
MNFSNTNFDKAKIDNTSVINTAINYVEWASKYNNGFVITGASNGIEFKGMKSCEVDFSKLYFSIKATSYALTWRTPKSVLWGKIAYSNLFWIGECSNGKANGDGVIGWAYINKWNDLTEEGLVTSVVKMNNGNIADGVVSGNKLYQESGMGNRARLIKRDNNIQIAKVENGVVKDIASSRALASVESSNNAGAELFGAIMAPVVKYGIEVLESAKDGKSTYVTVEMVCGLSSCPVKKFTIKGSSGNVFSVNTSSSYMESKGGIYYYTATFDNNYGTCSGSFKLTGHEKNYNIKFYKDCRDAGSYGS